MITKLLEIRDDGTFIPVLAFQLDSENEGERYLLARAGYGTDRQTHSFRTVIVLWKMDGGKGQATSDANAWKGGSRTMREAHLYIKKNWLEIATGDVIDVEFILGETSSKKITERGKS